LAAAAVAGLAVPVVPTAGFDPDATAEAGFADGVLAGFAAFGVAALAGELGAELAFGLAAVCAGLATEFAGGAGFGICAGFAAESPVETSVGEAGIAGPAGLVGAG